jgi:hypothetical protein
LSSEQCRQGRRLLKGLSSFQDENLTHLSEKFSAAWVEAEWALAETLTKREPRRIAFAMLRRVVDWLRHPRCEDPKPLRTWILLATDRGGNCARLVLTPAPQGLHEPLAFPDPIRLGLLPVDRDWRAAFDAAALAINSCCNAAQHLPRVTWSLEFVSGEVVRRLGQSRPGLHGSLARPCFMRGPSASAAFAALWAVGARGQIPRDDVVVAAEVLASGELRPVGAMPEKLDAPLWQAFLGTFLRRLIIRGDASLSLRTWTQAMAARAGNDQDGFLKEADHLTEVVDRLARAPRNPLHRRAWLGAAGAGLGAVVVASPTVRRNLFPAALADQEVKLRIFVRRQGQPEELPLGEAEPPFVPGDGVRVELVAQRPCYFYVFWIDALGKAAPIWPWRGQDWQARLADRDRPTTELNLPAATANEHRPLFRLLPDAPGLQTILAVARRTRLPESVNPQALLTGIPPQPPASPWRADVALSIAADGIRKIVLEAGSNHVVRTPIGEELFQESADDPLRHIQRIVRSRFDGNGEVVSAVSFAFDSPAIADSERGSP